MPLAEFFVIVALELDQEDSDVISWLDEIQQHKVKTVGQLKDFAQSNRQEWNRCLIPRMIKEHVEKTLQINQIDEAAELGKTCLFQNNFSFSFSQLLLYFGLCRCIDQLKQTLSDTVIFYFILIQRLSINGFLLGWSISYRRLLPRTVITQVIPKMRKSRRLARQSRERPDWSKKAEQREE